DKMGGDCRFSDRSRSRFIVEHAIRSCKYYEFNCKQLKVQIRANTAQPTIKDTILRLKRADFDHWFMCCGACVASTTAIALTDVRCEG
ncbi:hypothetical protein NECAME_19077, partial [Necator americanus]